jgi:serine protease Do
MRAALMIAVLGAMSASAAGTARGQAGTMARAFSFFNDDANRPRLGISTRSSGKRDTLGLLVDAVAAGSPAEKAGIEEGDRLVSINGVNLRLSRDDVEDDDMSGVATRRLTRELAKHKAGEDVELKVYRDGQTRSLHAKVVAADELEPELKTVQSARTAMNDRAVLGLALGGSGSRRDTLGVLVVGVTDDGPAAKAGIEEGDRIASINGVDLRVERDDAGDWDASSARIRRLNRTMEKVKVGDDVELRVYAQGQTRTVRAKAARAGDLPRSVGGFFMQDGGFGAGPVIRIRPTPAPAAPLAPTLKVAPRIYYEDSPARARALEAETRAQVEALRKAAEAGARTARLRRWQLDDEDSTSDKSSPTPAPAAISKAAAAPRLAYAASSLPTMARFGAPVAASTVAYGQTMRAARTPRAGVGSLSANVKGMIGVPGLEMAPVSSDLASYLGVGSERGLLVVDVTDGWQGLHSGDVILSVDGRAVRNRDGSTSFVYGKSPRSVIELLRGGRRMRVEVDR